jgi:DNA invertase Pin-like site-specific DNA recombinase
MKSAPGTGRGRCAIYTRVSTDQGLDQDFNSLDTQYEAVSAYIKSQAHAGWTLIRSRYNGGYSGGSTDRPNLQRLLEDVRCRKVDVIVVYTVDRLTRSLADFAKLVELFDAHDVSFVSVIQQFNTTTLSCCNGERRLRETLATPDGLRSGSLDHRDLDRVLRRSQHVMPRG